MQRFFTVQKSTEFKNEKLLLPQEIFHHAVDVLRMKVDDQFELVTADERVYQCQLTKVEKHEGQFTIVKTIDREVEMPVKVTIVCGVSKGDKAEEIVKKGTQLGTARFIFLNSRYSVARWKNQKQVKKIKRLQTIALNAAEQSHRNHVPEVEWADSLDDVIAMNAANDFKVVAYEESAKQDEKTVLAQIATQAPQARAKESTSLVAFFGPEGGIAPEEIEQLTAAGYQCAGLGPRILRAETAPLYLLAALSFATELE